MAMDHEAVRDNIDAWAIGALDAAEAREVDSHLAGCDACRVLADEAQDDAGMIALAVPLVAAPASLKARVMGAAAAVRPAQRGRQGWRYWPAAAAAVFVFGFGLVGWNAYLQNEVGELDEQNVRLDADATAQTGELAEVRSELTEVSASTEDLSQAQDAVLEIAAQPDLQRLPMTSTMVAPESTGRYLWSSAGGVGALVVSDMPQLESDQSYCLWVMYERAWVLAGLFDVDENGSGRLIVRDIDAREGETGALTGFVVTIEPSESLLLAAKPYGGDPVLQTRVR